jgi:hypothetical protein
MGNEWRNCERPGTVVIDTPKWRCKAWETPGEPAPTGSEIPADPTGIFTN